MILDLNSSLSSFETGAGGKGLKLYELAKAGCQVPPFLVVSQEFFANYLSQTGLSALGDKGGDFKKIEQEVEEALVNTPLPSDLAAFLRTRLEEGRLLGTPLAVRSSGLDEDSSDQSFAGMFSSFLYQRTYEEIELSLRRCWASAYGERVLRYRSEQGLSLNNIKMGVVVQSMIDSEVSGVMFTRNPMDPLDRTNLVIDSVYGQCEGLVSGLLDADHYRVNRATKEIEQTLAQKEERLVSSPDGHGLAKVSVEAGLQKESSLSLAQLMELADLGLRLEKEFGAPMDIEWTFASGKLWVLQCRPVTTLPPEAFYDERINGTEATLWDNSNIVESFAGVTTPLTFSGTKKAYAIVYRQTCRLLGVPEKIIEEYDEQFENMLGFVKGRVYYNLINWYKLLLLMPGAATNKGFMETMMGVREGLDDKRKDLFDFVNSAPKYSSLKKISVMAKLFWNFLRIDRLVAEFSGKFDNLYQEYNRTNFETKSLKELKRMYLFWEKSVTYNWKPPIINDFLCMVFFGALKSMTEKWLKVEQDAASLQNDLLCGQGDLDSALPVKTLMGIAQRIDQNPEQREFVLSNAPKEIWDKLQAGAMPPVRELIANYLELYGFRCNNEQKLEENDLNDDPSFLFQNLQSYLKMKNYSIDQMEERERAIRDKAEALVKEQLGGLKLKFYFWTLKHARNAVKNRENLRFLRTKAFGVSRRLFRAIGSHLEGVKALPSKSDVFYLTVDELWDFIDGRAESLALDKLAQLRKEEHRENLECPDPPDRFLTYGSAGASFRDIQILNSGDLLKDLALESSDPSLLLGVSCCPGVVTGTVVVANSIEEAGQLNGEILVAKRTDPGWVPLYPSCSGLIIERGSLLSHSAVIARELGLPTVVGVSGGLMTKLKTGDRVELNATKGEVRILSNEN